MRVLFFLQFIFFVIAILFTVLQIKYRFFSNKTSSKVYKRKLKNIEFPCFVSIIVSDAFDLKYLRSHFYTTPFTYFMGGKYNNGNWYAWYDWSGNNSTVRGELDTTYLDMLGELDTTYLDIKY